MGMRVVWITEVISILYCMDCVYGEKTKWDKLFWGATGICWMALEIIWYFQINWLTTLSVLLPVMLYSRIRYKRNWIEVTESLVLCVIAATSLQFCMLCATDWALSEQEVLRDLVCNAAVFLTLCFLSKKGWLHQLQKIVFENSRFIFLVMGILAITVLAILIPWKLYSDVHKWQFILIMPVSAFLFYAIIKWYRAKEKTEDLQQQISVEKENQEKYDELLNEVRVKQHAFKNHMAALYSAHYNCHDYQELVEMQTAYSGELLAENKYNNLLLIGNQTLGGYLYGKFSELEKSGVTVEYELMVKKIESTVPIHRMIEMLGILLDNAAEAVREKAEGKIVFSVREESGSYIFSVKNPFRHVGYQEIESWFQQDKSTKGAGRGLGLYHLKGLCQEFGCSILTRSMEIEEENWIVFTLEMPKAEGE